MRNIGKLQARQFRVLTMGSTLVGETEVGGFIIAAGHGSGMWHGPATGEALAALIVDGKPIPFAEQLSIARFRN